MLVRAFRLLDKLSNALLKLAVWVVTGMVQQTADLRQGMQNSTVDLFNNVTGATQTVARGSLKVYEATDQRRRTMMAQRAALITTEQDPRALVVEDPLITQNRTLSVFAVLLMISLIAVVVWSTNRSNNDNTGLSGGNFAGDLPQQANEPTRPLLPSPTPLPTAVPQPLNWRGTLVFTVRQNGQDDIYALQRGSTQPIQLTNHPADDRDPVWSPDGRTIAFASKRDGPWALYTLDVVTGQVTRLTYTSAYAGSPTFSPDGVFIAYEAYTTQDQNLNIHLVAVDGSQGPFPVTTNPGPDYEPAWMPDRDGAGGRRIAYTAWRNGQQDIFVIDLNNPSDQAALNLTNTREIDEDYPAWSPDGRAIAYSAVADGIEGVFFRVLENPGAEIPVGRGRMPTWNPVDGSSLFYTAPRQNNFWQILAAQTGSFGGGGDLTLISGIISDLDWTAAEPEFEGVPPNPSPLYTEQAAPSANGLYGLGALPGIVAPDAYLNARVDDSFNALRLRVIDRVGVDVLGELGDAFWRLERSPEVGQPREGNWHYAGRAFAVRRNLISQGNPTPMVVVREDREVGTYWRVYLRVNESAQNGMLGEPLRQIPWDFDARVSGDVEAYEQGGRLMALPPAGYYVDFTQLAADFGWYPVPAGRAWRQNFGEILYWDFVKTDGLDWPTAMRELYTEVELESFLSGATLAPITPIPAATEAATDAPTETEEAVPTATPPLPTPPADEVG